MTVVLQPLPHQDAGKGKGAGRAAAAEHKGKQVCLSGRRTCLCGQCCALVNLHTDQLLQSLYSVHFNARWQHICARPRSAAPSGQSVLLTAVLQKLVQHLTSS